MLEAVSHASALADTNLNSMYSYNNYNNVWYKINIMHACIFFTPIIYPYYSKEGDDLPQDRQSWWDDHTHK